MASDTVLPAGGKRTDTEVLPAIVLPHEPVQIGPYRIVEVVARGGMGTVYRARVVISCEVPMGSEVAIKLLRTFGSREERLRFAREAGYLQSLRHAGIVRVLDAGEYEGQPYLVMPLIDGLTLQQFLANHHRLGENETAEIAIQALEALHTAHLAGILHRDVKPGNIMLSEEGGVKLVDFGLANRLDHQSSLTATGAVVGTPAYMSPEQAAGERQDVGPRSDVYSLSACCYEMLTGAQPFEAENAIALLRVVIDQPLTPPSQLRPGLSYDMETIVLVGMAKHPTDRYRNAEAMANDLRRFRQGLPILTPRPGGWRTWLRTGWDNRSLLALVSLLVFVAGGTVAVAARVALQDRNPTPQTEQPVIDTAWVDEAIGDGRKTLDWRPYTPLGKDVELATVGSVVGPVRLGVTAQILSETVHIELLICDRDIGRGYTLRLQSNNDNGATLALLREDKVVTSRDLSPLTVGTLLSLHLDRIDDTVTASCNDEEALSFIDLAPIEGPDADAVHLARTMDSLAVTHIRLERQRTGLFVSALAPADSLRQEGRFARAIVAYESFLRDQPNSPFARDARFRIALCHEALHDDERALTAYLEVARLDRDHAHHAIAALFRAWGCSLRLGRYQEAEQYFAAIRRSHDLPSLLASVPEDTINAVIADYAERAVQLRTSDPQRAVSLYSTGADLAAYLGLPTRVRTLRFASADLLLALDRPQDVLTHLTDLPIDDPERLLRVGHAQRLMGHDRAAIAAYRGVIAADPDGVLGHWARWWAGDLVLLMDDDSEARTTWWEPAQGEDLPCRLMRHLMLGNRPMSLPEVDSAVVEYANARLAWRRGLDQQYRERLTNTVSLATDGAWPVPLARRLLGNEGTGP